ncbi:MAG: hypothetical protein PHZ04_02305 [Patescibacteria group bacterium]|nr:hypothetical protein [Patescibacteria group bacterium]MDD5294326.1 hypothetical protein [Patescibacteria group bacterium]MDD5554149.1 hypothetical protein [Patescibacteria group bacterium]
MREGFGNPRFGESFNPDQTNRLDVLKRDEKLPEYIDFSREIRNLLRTSIEKEGWPACPENIKSVEEILEKADEAVTEKWDKYAGDFFEDKCREWAGAADDSENQELKETLSDRDEMETNLRLQYLGGIEKLRDVNPSAWRSMILASSERQLAKTVLLKRWAREMPEETFEKIGTTREELDLFLDAAALLGKYVDQAYVKQIELADAPGGSAETELAGKQGSEYVYDLYKAGGENPDIKTYSEVFQFEWSRLVGRIETLAQRVENLILENKIPSSYESFPDFLREIAQAYGSKETDPEKLDKMWDGLSIKTQELALAGCPLMIIPQGSTEVAGEAGKVDIELRLAFQSEYTKELEKLADEYRTIAQNIVDSNKNVLSEPYDVPRQIFNTQYFSFGPNLASITQAETGEGFIASHVNTIAELAKTKQIPLLEKAFPGEKVSPEGYKEAAIIETSLHEYGHSILSTDDEKIYDKIGSSKAADVIEELKAETLAAKLLWEKHSRDDEVLRKQFQAKMGTICDYLKNKTEKEEYYYPAIIMIHELISQGVIKEKDEGYEIADCQKGVQALANLGTEILENFYLNKESKPADVKNYFRQIKELEDEEKIKKFIGALK